MTKTKRRSKRASYREGVRWIALNDEPSEYDVETVSDLISTQLLSDLFGKHPILVAEDVLRERAKEA